MNEINSKLIIALVIVPTLFGVFTTWKEMATSGVLICLALAFANLEKFSSFKGAGFEAQMRDVKSAVDNTYAAISELKDLALSLSAPIVDEMAVSGRMFQYIPLKDKLQRVEEIAQRLRKLGASEREIKEACSTIFERIGSDHLKAVLYTLRDANPSEHQLFDGLEDWKMDDWSIKKLLKFIDDNKLSKDDKISEALLDLEFFTNNQKLRRPDHWQS